MNSFYADNYLTAQQQNQRLAQLLQTVLANTPIVKIDRVSLPPPPVPAGAQAGWLVQHN